LALRLRALGRTDEAVRILEEGRDEDPREVSILLAEHYMEVDDFPAALAAFQSGFPTKSDEELFELLPEEYRFMLGDILVLTHEEARLRTLIQHIEEPAYRDFLEARMFQEQGDHRRALESFDSGFRLWPGSAGARFLAGQSASKLGDFDTAIDHYRGALRTDASLSNAGLELARLYAASGSHTAAVSALSIHVKAHPTDAEALRILADLYLALGQKERSAEARGVLEGLPGERDHAFADQARDLARYSAHQHALDFIAANVPDLLASEFESTLAVWCEIMRSTGRADEALAFLSSEAAHARDGQAYRDALRGQILRNEGRVGEAEAAFTAALDADPSEWRAALGQARLLAEKGRTQEAIGLFDRVSDLVDDDPVALYESGVLLAFGPDLDEKEASRRLKEALLRQPTYGVAALTLATIALAQGDESDEAIGFALRAARLLRSPESALVAAELQMARGEARQAIEAIEWAIDSGAREGVVHHLHARALLMVGDEDRARAALEDALEYEPFAGSEAARQQLSRLGGARTDAGSG
jgi:tetratricopeptide (TPR) repeat protein